MPHALGLKAGGHPPSDGLRQAFRLAWASLHDHWHAVGLLGAGLCRAGRAGLRAARLGRVPGGPSAHRQLPGGIAAAIYACGWMAAAWALASEAVRRCTLDGPAARWPERPFPPTGVSLLGGAAAADGRHGAARRSGARLTRAILGSAPSFSPGSPGALPPDLAARLQDVIPALRQDFMPRSRPPRWPSPSPWFAAPWPG